MGRGGSQVLHDIIAGGHPEPVLLEPTLSARDSTLNVSV
jgi:hypothetical protein